MASPNIPDDDVCLTTEEVSEWTGLSKQTLEGWRSRYKDVNPGPDFVKFGQAVRYRRGAVRRWLEEHTIRHTPTDAGSVCLHA